MTSTSVTLPVVADDRAVSPSSEGHSEPLHHCNQCSYSSVYKSNVLRHAKLVHSVVEDEQLSNGTSDKNLKSVPVVDNVIVKEEVIDPEVVVGSVDDTVKEKVADIECEDKIKQESNPDSVQSNDESKDTNKYCKSCNIAFNYYTTYVAHKKFYCSSHAGEITNANTNNNNPTNRAAETSVL